MVSKLRQRVKELADELDIEWNDFKDDRMRLLEEHLDDHKISLEEAMEAVRKELGYKFDNLEEAELIKKIKGIIK